MKKHCVLLLRLGLRSVRRWRSEITAFAKSSTASAPLVQLPLKKSACQQQTGLEIHWYIVILSTTLTDSMPAYHINCMQHHDPSCIYDQIPESNWISLNHNDIFLLEEILHQLIGSLPPLFTGSSFIAGGAGVLPSTVSLIFLCIATTCQNKKSRTFTLEGSSWSAADAESAAGPKPQEHHGCCWRPSW